MNTFYPEQGFLIKFGGWGWGQDYLFIARHNDGTSCVVSMINKRMLY
jgi:hypothetical protein